MSEQIEAEAHELHNRITECLNPARKLTAFQSITVLTLASINDEAGGQWVIGDKQQDRALVAKRLRVAADALEWKS